MEEILQLKITLQWTKPPIWRRVLVHKKTSFSDLHSIIQIAMGWHRSHLFQFIVHDEHIGEPHPGMALLGYHSSDQLDNASTETLEGNIREEKEVFIYDYDFGDNWRHEIVVEQSLPPDSKTKYPVCIGGELNCPPEDCGGIPGFYDMLEILADKSHPERKELLEWLENPYDPQHFDIAKVNKQLRKFARL